MDPYSYIANADGAAIDELYQSYQRDPHSVDAGWQKFFEGFEFSFTYGENGNGHAGVGNGTPAPAATTATPTATVVEKAGAEKELQVRNLIYAYRMRGHLRANTNPVRPRKDRKAMLDLADFGLTERDLDTVFEVGHELKIGPATLRKIHETLRLIYEGPIGFEYRYIRESEAAEWLKDKIETEAIRFNPSIEEKTRILFKLNEAVVFENFLQTKYLGQKRFSLEGGETTIPALDAIINKASELGAEECIVAMAHRGRLNVLVNIIGKTYENVFSEFEGTAVPDLTFGDGDVKYHMGYSSQVETVSGKKIHLKLAPNPSHLEAVNPVVEGIARAKGDGLYKSDFDKIIPILIHGDAALAGQGIVYEVTQMSKLAGYYTGGTIHFVINNQVGFTTDFEDARSSIYCTDVAKIIDAPVLHVNGDDAEAVVFCAKLAVEFRQRFNRDIFIDMVCYRRHGHNETDEPKFTQPTLYNVISRHPNPREIYNKKLIARGEVDAQLADKMDNEFKALLQDRLDMVKQHPLPYVFQKLEEDWKVLRRATPEDFEQSPVTGIPEETVRRIGEALVKIPEGFKPLKQIEKLLKDRRQMFFESRQLNWAAAELLAYGSFLLENKIVRLSGQDVQRGTFSHRHSVLHDAETNEAHNSLNFIAENQETFRVYNSLLSEYGVLGFEFGYAMANPNALVVWEAQFGDFANGTQVIIDQFIACSESKWQRMNGVVLLLPHGYEGQGPEHSNARPERFLQLSAEYNIIVANVTLPANFFHLLRRQLVWPFRKPCVVMSPKSLLRHPQCVSPLEDFTNGRFREVIGDAYAQPKQVKKVLLCSGKVYFDLLEAQQSGKRVDVAVVRVEQLHPFPTGQVDAELAKYNKGVSVEWVQEEPENMGAWSYVLRSYRHVALEVIARKPSASPAIGFAKIHAKEQEEIVKKAFS
ncbi:MAG: 2-oxoglutarate dehydrogenase E1 component [Ferruginibacter sp.]|nr:2-oxoglutarate dehydrogenase E1 component [Cytophagales bacterium]